MLRILLLMGGVLSSSSAALLLKASPFHATEIAAFRLLLAAVLLSPLFFINIRKHREVYSWRDTRIAMLPAFSLALHFILWAQGAKMATAANASLIVNMIPAVLPFLLFFIAGEKITRREIIGTLIALAGVALLASSDFALSQEHLQGDIICFFAMVMVTLYLVQARTSKNVPSLWLYVVPLYFFAGLLCLGVSLVVAEPFRIHPARDYLPAIGLALVPTIIGHSILNYSMKHLNGQLVTVCNLMQFIFAGLLAYLLFHETPTPLFYPAGALVVTGTIVVILAVAKTARGQKELEKLEEAAEV